MSRHRYNDTDLEAIYRVIAERRDMRHFKSEPIDGAVIQRLLAAAHCGPSVGYMQPWRFIRITCDTLRERIHAEVEAERCRTADVMGQRRDEFMRLKVEGIRECGELWIVALADGRERHVFGRRTMPEMDLASAACAIQIYGWPLEAKVWVWDGCRYSTHNGWPNYWPCRLKRGRSRCYA